MDIDERVRRTRSILEQNMPQYLALLEQMVGINSFTANAVGVNELGALTADIFASESLVYRLVFLVVVRRRIQAALLVGGAANE